MTYYGAELRKLCCGPTDTARGLHRSRAGVQPAEGIILCWTLNQYFLTLGSGSLERQQLQRELGVKRSLPTQTAPKFRPTILIFSHYTETPQGKEV